MRRGVHEQTGATTSKRHKNFCSLPKVMSRISHVTVLLVQSFLPSCILPGALFLRDLVLCECGFDSLCGQTDSIQR